jgi:hypothetical protein
VQFLKERVTESDSAKPKAPNVVVSNVTPNIPPAPNANATQLFQQKVESFASQFRETNGVRPWNRLSDANQEQSEKAFANALNTYVTHVRNQEGGKKRVALSRNMKSTRRIGRRSVGGAFKDAEEFQTTLAKVQEIFNRIKDKVTSKVGSQYINVILNNIKSNNYNSKKNSYNQYDTLFKNLSNMSDDYIITILNNNKTDIIEIENNLVAVSDIKSILKNAWGDKNIGLSN